MSNRHKHADLIHAWAEGAEIEREEFDGAWALVKHPFFDPLKQYRIKPEKKPDVVKYVGLIDDDISNPSYRANRREVIDHWPIQLKLTFCGETGKLIKAEVL